MTEDLSNATSPPQDEPVITEKTSPDSASDYDAVAASAKLHQAVLKAAQDAEDAVVRSLTSEGLGRRADKQPA
jgi:hypothetical protein